MKDAEFLASATDVINHLEKEVRRVKPEESARWRALEIGCGSGRLLRPMSRHFLALEGVDLSGPVTLEQIADGSIGFLYSYDFFQHLSNRELFLNFLRASHRVLQPGGLARFEFTGVPDGQFSSREILELAHTYDFQVLALEGVSTPSMWTTWRKRASGWSQAVANTAPSTIRRITNASSFEPVAPSRGRFASICLRVENLPDDAGLNHLRVRIGNSQGNVTYIGSVDRTGVRPIYVDLPELEATGLLPVQLFWLEEPISAPATLRVIPPGPVIPRILYAPKRAPGRRIRMTLEEVARPYDLAVTIGGRPVEDLEKFCTDPRAQRYEVEFHIPEEIEPGLHDVTVAIGARKLPSWRVQVDG